MFVANQIAWFFNQQDFQTKWMLLSDFCKGVRHSKKEDIKNNLLVHIRHAQMRP